MTTDNWHDQCPRCATCGKHRHAGPCSAPDRDAITAATENITAFLIGSGWTIADAAEVAPALADNIVAAVAPDIARTERERMRSGVIEAVGKFERDLALTTPELFPMRIQQLKERLADLLAGAQ